MVSFRALGRIRIVEPIILGPQLIHYELHNPIMRTTANVVSHVNVEQSIRPIRLGVEREATLVGVGVDLTLDRRSLRRLSHFSSLSFSLTSYIDIIPSPT